MRGEFLGDLEDYARLLRTAERGPQPSEKMAKLVNIIARLSVRGFLMSAKPHPLFTRVTRGGFAIGFCCTF